LNIFLDSLVSFSQSVRIANYKHSLYEGGIRIVYYPKNNERLLFRWRLVIIF
jgi:hypothetical protein